MKYPETAPYNQNYDIQGAIQGQGNFQTVSVPYAQVTPKPETLQNQAEAILSNLQALEAMLAQLEGKLFGPIPAEVKPSNPPFSSLGGNIYECRSLSFQLADTARKLCDRA